MDSQDNFPILQHPVPATLDNTSNASNNEDQSTSTICTPLMAPIILEEDANVCSAAIITLGDDSSEEGSVEAGPMDTTEDLIVEEEEVMVLHEEVTIIREEVTPIRDEGSPRNGDDVDGDGEGEGEGDVSHDGFGSGDGESEGGEDDVSQDDLDLYEEAGIETGSDFDGDEEDDGEGSFSDGTVLYIGEEEQHNMEVDEIHLESSSEVSKQTSEMEFSAEQDEMVDGAIKEELLIDLTEPLIDVEHAQPSPIRADRDYEEEASENSILDSPIEDEFADVGLGNDLSPEEASSISEYRGNTLTLQQELEDVSEDSVTLDMNASAEYGQDSDNDSFCSFTSDDEEKVEQMEPGNKYIWKEAKCTNWVAKDLSRILDPKTEEMSVMPEDFRGRKRALMQLFLLLSRIVFFIDLGVRRDRIFKLIPERFWLQHFTWTESGQLFEARDKELCINLLSRTKTILDEWGLSCGFPRVPELSSDVEMAKGDLQKADRQQRVESLLQTRSHKSDRWLTHIFLDFIDVLPWKDLLETDGDVRKVVIQKVVTMTELCFEQPISIVEEFQDVMLRRESMRKVVQEQLHIVLEKTCKLTLVG